MFETGKVKEFFGLCCPYYYIGEQDVAKDEEIKRYYSLALEDIEGYLTALLEEELEGGRYTGAGVSLVLPMGNMDIHVGGVPIRVVEGVEPDYVYTPIGRLDMHTYRAVMKDDDNPVRFFYTKLAIALLNMRDTVFVDGPIELSGKLLECGEILSQEWLRKYDGYRVNDPLGLYRYDSVWLQLEKFFEEGRV